MQEVCGKLNFRFLPGVTMPGFGVTGSVEGADGSKVDGFGARETEVGKVGNASIEAKEQARARRIEMEKERQQRDDRIDEARAAVIVARAEMAAARELAARSAAAARAQFEATSAQIDEAVTATVARHRQAIDAAVRILVGERLTAAQTAQLTDLMPAQVRRICRGSGTDSPPTGTATRARASAAD